MQVLKKLDNEAKQLMLRKMTGAGTRMIHKMPRAYHSFMKTAELAPKLQVEIPTANTIERVAKRIRN